MINDPSRFNTLYAIPFFDTLTGGIAFEELLFEIRYVPRSDLNVQRAGLWLTYRCRLCS
jgi:hypothetical protein